MLEMKYTPHSIRYPPRAPRLCFCRQTNWWAVVWLVQCKWVSRFETFGQICCDINLRAILQSTSVHKLLAENTKMRTVNTTVSFSILVVSLSSMFRTSVVRRTSSRNMLARFHCFAAVASRRQTKSLLRTGGKTKKWGEKPQKKTKIFMSFYFMGRTNSSEFNDDEFISIVLFDFGQRLVMMLTYRLSSARYVRSGHGRKG